MRSFLVLVSLWISVQVSSACDVSHILPQFETYTQQALSEWQAPGVGIVIVKDGQIIYEKGLGITNVQEPRSIDSHTLFPIASLSKNFLVTLIARLVDENVLDWDAPVQHYLPDFRLSDPEVTQKFTVKDLLSHRSGLKSFAGDTLWNLDFSAQEIKQGLAQLPLAQGFRQEYAYQNHLYGIASELVEKVTGKPIAVVMQDKLFTPLGLNDTIVGPLPEPKKGLWAFFKHVLKKTKEPNIASPHSIYGGKISSLPVVPMMYTFKGSTGIHTTVHDLGLWMIFQLNGGKTTDHQQIISAHQIQQMRSPHAAVKNLRPDDIQFPSRRIQNVSYGMGWFLQTYGEGNKYVHALSHMGGFAGVRSLMTLIPEQKLGIAIVSNFGAMRVSMLPEALRNKFLDLYLGLSNHDWSQENLQKMATIRNKNKQYKNAHRLQNPRKPHDLSVYVGIYENPLYGRFEIQKDQNQLFLLYRKKRVPLQHWNGDEFQFKGYDLSLVYSDYDQGYIEFAVQNRKAVLSAINLMFEGKSEIFKRI